MRGRLQRGHVWMSAVAMANFVQGGASGFYTTNSDKNWSYYELISWYIPIVVVKKGRLVCCCCCRRCSHTRRFGVEPHYHSSGYHAKTFATPAPKHWAGADKTLGCVIPCPSSLLPWVCVHATHLFRVACNEDLLIFMWQLFIVPWSVR